MNRPSPDDLNDIIMAEQRAKIEDLKKENKKLKEKVEQMEKYQQNNRIKLKKVQGENYKLKKCIEMLKKSFSNVFGWTPTNRRTILRVNGRYTVLILLGLKNDFDDAKKKEEPSKPKKRGRPRTRK